MNRQRKVGRSGRLGRAGRALLAVVLVVPLLQAAVTPAAADIPALDVQTTSYSATEPAVGMPISYTSTVDVSDSSGTVTLTHTMPAGVTPLGGYGGAEWLCQAPSGQSITCTTSGGSFGAGTTLAMVTFSGIVTAAGLTASTIQTSSSTVASSNGASVTNALMTAGTVPSAPSEVSVSETVGSVSGGNPLTVLATTDVPPTALLIGTAAELAAGTPQVQLPCQTGTTAGCFTPGDDGSHIESMPARPAPGAVEVMVLTLGVGASTSYTYDPDTSPTGPAADPGGAEPPSIMPAQVFGPLTLNPGEEGVPYSHTLASPPGVPVPQSWAVSGGTVPPGLRLNSAGQLSGIPSTAGDYVFEALLTGFGGERDTLPVTLSIAARPVVTVSAADGQQGLSYSEQPSVEAGIAPFTWSIVAGALPAGLTVDPATGLISGTPTVSGTFSASLAAVDALGQRGTATFSLVIVPAPMVTFTPPTSGQVAVPYSTTFTATGTGPLAWSISDGDLPAGLTLDPATGVLSGTPMETGSSTFTVTVTDANGFTADKAATLVIRPGALVITVSADAKAQALTIAGQTVTYTVLAKNTGSVDLEGATFIDDLRGVRDDADENSDVGAVYAGGGTGSVAPGAYGLQWTGDLPAGASVRITYSVTVKNRGNQLLFNAISSSTPGSNCPQISGDDPRCGSSVSVRRPLLSITATTDVASANPGDVVTISIDASAQYGAYPGAEFSLDLAGMTDDAVYNNDATATIGNVTATSASLSWTGDLTPGEPAVVTLSVTVADPPAGDNVLTGTVESTSPDFLCGDGESTDACNMSVVIQRPGLTITNRLGAAPELWGHWTFDEGAGSTANDTATIYADESHPATLTGGAGWTAGTQGGAALSLDGISGSADISSDTLDTAESFSVSAWVKVNPFGRDQTAVSQDGATTSAFTLGVRNGRFGFGRVSSDGSITATASAAGGIGLNRWYQLLGVYDRSASTLSLYVDGQLQQTVAAPQLAPSTGQLVIGRGQAGENDVDFLDGAVDDVQIYRGVLTGGSPATAGAVQEFSMTIANSGQTDYSFTDAAIDLTGALDDAVYNQNSAIVRMYGTPLQVLIRYDSDNKRLLWTGDLPVGAVITVVATLSMNAPTTGDSFISTTATTSAVGSSCPIGGTTRPSICRASAVVLIPELTITQTANVSTASPGSVLQYTVTARNTGQTDYQEATLVESLAGILDDAIYNGDIAATSGTASVDDSSVDSSNLNWTGDLAAGASATMTYSVTVDGPGLGDRVLSGVVTSPTLASNCASESTDPRCSSSVAVLDPALSLSITPDVAAALPGSPVRYTVTANNSGETDYKGAVVTVDLTGVLDDAIYRSGRSSAGTLSTVDGLTTWTLTLPTGTSATAELAFVVNRQAGGDGAMTALVTSGAAGSSCPADNVDPTCSAEVAMVAPAVPALSIEKTSDITSTTVGGTVNYQISVVNSGEIDFPTAALTDPLAGVLDDATYNGDASATSGTVSFDAGTLSWTGDLATGQGAVISYSVTVNNPDNGDRQLTGAVRSTTAGSNCAPGSTDTRCTSAVSVVESGLTIQQTAEVYRGGYWVPLPEPGVAAGQDVQFITTVTNTGPNTVLGATFTQSLTDLLDDGNIRDYSATMGGWDYDNDGGPFTWSGNLDSGATARITFLFSPRAADEGDDLLSLTAVSNTVGSNCPESGDDSRCRITVPVARLTIAEEPAISTPTAEGTLRQVTTFTNNGQVPYKGVTITADTTDLRDDLLPTPGLTARTGIVTESDTSETWTGDIPVGGVITLYSNYTAITPAAGDRWVSRTWTTSALGSDCTIYFDNPACRLIVAVPVLMISQVANTTEAAPGDTVSYTFTVQNSGWGDLTGISASVELAGLLDDATFGTDPITDIGTASRESENLTWTGDLVAGEVATVMYSVTVADPDLGDKALTSKLQSSTPGSNCQPSTTDPSCWLSVPVLTPLLVIEHTTDLSAAFSGDTATFRVVVSNAGQIPFPEANFEVPLDGVIDDAQVTVTDPGNGESELSGGVLHWHGELAVGDSTTVTYTATVNHDTDHVMRATATSTSAGSNCAAGSHDTRCTATTWVAWADDLLSFATTADAVSTSIGGTVTFKVAATSSAETDLPFNLMVPLDGILDDATVTVGPQVSRGDASVGSNLLTWEGSVPANGSASMTFSVTVNSESAGDGILALTAAVDDSSFGNCRSGSDDPVCAVTVPIARLHIVQVAPAGDALQGSTVILTTTLTNTGRSAYEGISVALSGADGDDTIPVGNQTASAGFFARLEENVVWVGDLPVGGEVTLTRSFLVRDPPTGDRLLTAVVSSNALGNNCPVGAIDPDCTLSLDVVPAVVTPGVTVSLSADTEFLTPGGTATFTMVVTDPTDIAYGLYASADLSGLLDDAVYNGDASATAGTVEFDGTSLNWSGEVSSGNSVVITYTATVLDPEDGDLALISTVSTSGAPTNCLPGENRSACMAVVVVKVPELTITTATDTPTSTPGAVVTYTVTAVNSGQTDYAAATFDVHLAGSQTLNDDASSTTGTVIVIDGGLSWSGDLAVGAAVTVTFSTTVGDVVFNRHLAPISVESATIGSNCGPGTTDTRCVTTVAIAGLNILTYADRSTAGPTDVVTYTATFTNTGQVAYRGISIAIDLAGSADDATYNGDAAASAGSTRLEPDGLTLTWTGDIATFDIVTLTASVTVNDPDTGDKSIGILISTAAAASNCPVSGPDSGCSTTVTGLTPQLTVATVANTSTSTPGAIVYYTITIANSGETDYAPATVTDDLNGILDEADYQADAEQSDGLLDFTDGVLTWSGDLPVGATVLVTFSVQLHDPYTGDLTLVNTVESNDVGSNCGADSADPACRSAVSVLIPELTMSITAETGAVTPGGIVDYAAVISNTGQTPYYGATAFVTLDGALDDAALNPGLFTDTGTIDDNGIELFWYGDLPVGTTATITFSMTVRSPATGDGSMTASVTSGAAGSTCTNADPCISTVTVTPPAAGLTMSTATDTATAIPGDEVRFTISVVNSSQTPYQETTVTMPLDDILDDATFTGYLVASSGRAGYSAPTVTWTGDVPAGGTVTITYAATVNETTIREHSLTGTVQADGSNCALGTTDPVCTVSVPVLIPRLTISTSAEAATTTPGSVVRYFVSISNSGETAYTAASVTQSLRALLTNASYNGDAAATRGTFDYTEPDLTWTGDIGLGEAISFSFSVTVLNPDTGDKNMITTVRSDAPGSSCPPGTQNPDCDATVRVLLPQLTISQAADSPTVVAGSPVTFTITAVNTGPADYLSAVITEDLTGILDDGAVDDPVATTGTVDVEDGTLYWTGDLASGDSVTITFSVTTSFPAPGDHLIAGSAVSPDQGNNCAADSADPACTTQVTVLIPELTIVKSVDRTEVVPGGTARYTITATNTGEADYPAASLSDSFGGLVDDAVYNDDATASSGRVTYAPPALDWAGELAIGDSVTISYSVTVDTPSGGDLNLANSVRSRSVGSTCPWAGPTVPPCATSTPVNNITVALSDLTETVELAGPPDTTVTRNGAVTMTIDSNNPGGYTVTVQGAADQLVSTDIGSTATIPLSDLEFRETGTTLFQSLTTDPQLVHDRFAVTAPDGDAVSSDYQMHLPYADPGTYTVTLEYLVTAQ